MVSPGVLNSCYRITIIGPPGSTFTDSQNRWLTKSNICVTTNQTKTIDANIIY